MRRSVVLLALTGALLPGEPGCVSAGRADTAKRTPAQLAARIDEHLAAGWKAKKATPAPLADDAEFVRRATLDLAGRIPDILTARDFADDPGKDKRAKLIDKLLASDRYPAHFANVWRSWILPEAGANFQLVYMMPGFESWLASELKSNNGHDKVVRALVMGTAANNAGFAFYQANQNKPEEVASAVSRLFLGVKIECAQCHDHPFAKWTRKQFWETAAFFTSMPGYGIRRGKGLAPPGTAGKPGEIKIPGSDKVIKARFLDGKAPKLGTQQGESSDPRSAFLDWMAAADNPFFARATVNRVWEYLTGTGIVEPIDDQRDENPASHPTLLDEMAQQFVANQFDLKYLIKAITLSRAYQLTSRQTHSSQQGARAFARMKVRGLSPEQLFDSLIVATGQREEVPINPYASRKAFNPNVYSPRQDFIRRFPTPDKRSEQQTSILQALYLMNGKIVSDATSLEHNKNLAIIAEATTVRTSRRVEQVFLLTLGRKPRPAESDRLVKYVEGGGPSKDPKAALCDVFWALLNSSEFCVNH
jgi:hypothetical protein